MVERIAGRETIATAFIARLRIRGFSGLSFHFAINTDLSLRPWDARFRLRQAAVRIINRLDRVNVRNPERAEAPIKMPVMRFSRNICREIVVKFMRQNTTYSYELT